MMMVFGPMRWEFLQDGHHFDSGRRRGSRAAGPVHRGAIPAGHESGHGRGRDGCLHAAAEPRRLRAPFFCHYRPTSSRTSLTVLFRGLDGGDFVAGAKEVEILGHPSMSLYRTPKKVGHVTDGRGARRRHRATTSWPSTKAWPALGAKKGGRGSGGWWFLPAPLEGR